MQQVTRKTLGAGINLTCVTTPKFKRAVLRAMLVLPLGGEDAALRACLPQVLRRGTARLNDMQAFGTALDELYGARIEAAVRKEGENLCIGFLSDCIDEAYAPGADGLTAGVILAIDRSIGEAMAVSMVAGNQPIISGSLLSGVRTLTANIVLEMGYAADMHHEALLATGVVLFIFILLINLSFSLLRKGEDK